MKYLNIKSLIGISAVVICAGAITFITVDKLGKANEVTAQEIADQTETHEGNAYAKDIDLKLSNNEVKHEQEITVFYDQCATPSDTLKMLNFENVDYIVSNYKAPVFFDYMKGLDYNYELNEEEGYVANDTMVVSDNYEFTDDGKLLVRDMKMNTSIPVVKYLRVSENEVEARYISAAATNDSSLVSGLTFVMEKNEEGYYKLTGLKGVFGEDVSKLLYYEGTFDAWAMSMDGEGVYEPNDEIRISGDLTLYPHFIDNEASKHAKADGTCMDDMIEEIDGFKVLRVIHIKGTKKGKDGTLVSTDKKYALSDFDAEKDTVRTSNGVIVQRDTIKAQQSEDTDPKAKAEEKSSTDVKPGTEKPTNNNNNDTNNNTKDNNTTAQKDQQPSQPQQNQNQSAQPTEQKKQRQEPVESTIDRSTEVENSDDWGAMGWTGVEDLGDLSTAIDEACDAEAYAGLTLE